MCKPAGVESHPRHITLDYERRGGAVTRSCSRPFFGVALSLLDSNGSGIKPGALHVGDRHGHHDQEPDLHHSVGLNPESLSRGTCIDAGNRAAVVASRGQRFGVDIYAPQQLGVQRHHDPGQRQVIAVDAWAVLFARTTARSMRLVSRACL